MLNIVSFFWFLFHPFYVSVTTIELSRNQEVLEITSRIFYDDLEVALKDEFHQKIDLTKNQKINDELLSKYFSKYFSLKINGQAAKVEYLGYSLEKEAAWCFLEVKKPGRITSLTALNSLLYPQFKEQINIIHLDINKIKKSQKLNNPKNLAKFDF